MRQLILFFLLLLWTSGTVRAQQSALLQRRVQLAVTDQPLGEVLREVSRRSGVNFSYSNSIIPLQSRVTLRTTGAQSVESVLTKLCRSRGLSWQLVDEQVVLWRTAAGPPPQLLAATKAAADKRRALTDAPRNDARGSAATRQLPQPSKTPAATQNASSGQKSQLATTRGAGAATASRTRTSAAVRSNTATTKLGTRGLVAAGTQTSSNQKAVAKPVRNDTIAVQTPTLDSAETVAATRRGSLLPALQEKARQAAQAVTRAARRVGDAAGNIEPLTSRLVRAKSGLPTRDTLLAMRPEPTQRGRYYQRQAQVTFVPPLGSNWVRGGRTINAYSLNVLAGYSAGGRRLEIGGLVNVVRDTVRGVQLAGLTNVVGVATKGFQAAGLANIQGGSVQGVQAAGLANIIRDDARGVQMAGLVNIVGGAATVSADSTRPVLLRRFLGVPRLLATNPAAATLGAPGPASLPGPLLQFAGLANLTGTDVRGVQAAPLLNTGRRIKGVQFGLVNVARHVRGTQVGIVNIADSVNGVTFGLINIVRYGYHKGEVWASETLPLNAVLKLGVTRYYTIFGVASQPIGTRVRWAFGFGIGTSGKPHGRFIYSLDLLQWTLTEPGADIDVEARALTQLRPTVAWQIEANGHLRLIVSPTLNLAAALDLAKAPDWDFGANQLLLINRTDSNSIWRMWPGLQVGVRF